MRVLLLALALILFTFSPAKAQQNNVINELTFKAVLQQNGSINAEQIISYESADNFSWKIHSNINDLKVFADNTELSKKEFSRRKNNGTVTLQSSKQATTWKVTYNTTSTLIRHNDRDQFFYKILENPGVIIYNFSAQLILPSEAKDISANIYGIGGVSSKETEIDKNLVNFSSFGAGPQSLITLNASWPKEVLNLSAWENVRLTLSNLELIPWIFLGILMPISALIVLIIVRNINKRNNHLVTEVIDLPPDSLSPIFVGTLVNKKIYPEEVVAMLLDLCQRGYLVIVKKVNGFYLTPRKPIDEHLSPWEAEILAQIFASTKNVTSQHATQDASKELFSKDVRAAFAEIYNVITSQKYFTENPHITRIRNKLIGLMLFFFALGAIIYNTISGANSYLLIPLIGTLFMSKQILAIAPNLIKYTNAGVAEKQQWLKFANYLKSKEPLEITKVQAQYYEKFLPYAVALRCTNEWASRFDNAEIFASKPDWLVCYEETNISDTTNELIEFIGSISTNISKLRGPVVS